MALTPTKTDTPGDKRKPKESSEGDVLMREVDDAVRQDEFSDVLSKYGKPALAVVVLALASFAGYLYWDGRQEAHMEQQSEALTSALDQVEAGNLETSVATLQPLADEGSGGAKAAALMLQAGIAQEQGKSAEAAKIFAQVAANGDTPATLKDLAAIREIAATYDTRKPADVIAKLKPLAVPGNPYFGSAGEIVAMAYLDQGKTKEAGTLFAEIAKSEDVPDSLRSRARRMAGLYGVDAIVDVEEALKESTIANRAPSASAPNAAQ